MYMGAWQEYKLACLVAEHAKLAEERRKQKLRELDFSRLNPAPSPIQIRTNPNAPQPPRPVKRPVSHTGCSGQRESDQIIEAMARDCLEKRQRGGPHATQSQHPPRAVSASASSSSSPSLIQSYSYSHGRDSPQKQFAIEISGRLGDPQSIAELLKLRSVLALDKKEEQKPFRRMKLKRERIQLPVAPAQQDIANARNARVERLRNMYQVAPPPPLSSGQSSTTPRQPQALQPLLASQPTIHRPIPTLPGRNLSSQPTSPGLVPPSEVSSTSSIVKPLIRPSSAQKRLCQLYGPGPAAPAASVNAAPKTNPEPISAPPATLPPLNHQQPQTSSEFPKSLPAQDSKNRKPVSVAPIPINVKEVLMIAESTTDAAVSRPNRSEGPESQELESQKLAFNNLLGRKASLALHQMLARKAATESVKQQQQQQQQQEQQQRLGLQKPYLQETVDTSPDSPHYPTANLAETSVVSPRNGTNQQTSLLPQTSTGRRTSLSAWDDELNALLDWNELPAE